MRRGSAAWRAVAGAVLLAGLAACGALVPAPRPDPEPPPTPVRNAPVEPGREAASAAGRDTAPARLGPPGATLRPDEWAAPARPVPPLTAPTGRGPLVRVALATTARRVRLGADSRWLLVTDGGRLVASGEPGREWQVALAGAGLEAVPLDSRGGERVREGLVLHATGGAAVRVDGRRYRGEVRLLAGDSGVVVVNRLPVEDYLRGVVPREIGPRTMAEAAAVEAQAIAARSYTLVRLRETTARPWDLVGGVLNQAYGGADAETPVADAAVAATAGLVLLHDGAVINAPYHAACGGRTAAAPELWRTRGEPFLQPVDDVNPATGRPYCEIAPRYRWTARFTPEGLRQLAARWLPLYGGAPAGDVGEIADVQITGRTATDRVAGLSFATARGRYTVRANDTRFVLRQPNGELLNSTGFRIVATPARDGVLVVEGTGHGHGVGLCQWGAIARARAGQSARTILRTYFPGTSVGPAPGGAGD